jgi:hypothetical protein
LPLRCPPFRLDRGLSIAQARPPNSDAVTWDSPALDVMTDLTQVRAATTHPATTLRQAEQMMIYQGVRMLFVVTDMPSIEGLITTTDLRGDRQMRIVHERGLHYDDLCVGDVMTGCRCSMRSTLSASAPRPSPTRSRRLKRLGRNHLLVVEAGDRTDAAPRSRGHLALADRTPARRFDRRSRRSRAASPRSSRR